LCLTLRRNAVKDHAKEKDCSNRYRYVFDSLHHVSLGR
jgi:hypothetical protein